jgi:hypothetical protein
MCGNKLHRRGGSSRETKSACIVNLDISKPGLNKRNGVDALRLVQLD